MFPSSLIDGLYIVTTKETCAGFIVKNKHIIKAAPIFHKWLASPKGIAQLERLATRVCEGGCDDKRGSNPPGIFQENPATELL